MNQHAGIFKLKSKTPSLIGRPKFISILRLILPFAFLRLGSFVQVDVAYMFHETEPSHANLSRVVDCFRGEIHHSRDAGPPGQPQREVRRPLAQSGPPAAPEFFTRPRHTQFCVHLYPPNHKRTNEVTTHRSEVRFLCSCRSCQPPDTSQER